MAHGEVLGERGSNPCVHPEGRACGEVRGSTVKQISLAVFSVSVAFFVDRGCSSLSYF